MRWRQHHPTHREIGVMKRFRLVCDPLPKYVGVHRQVVKLLWYLDHPWSEANVRFLRLRLESWGQRHSPYDEREDVAAALAEFPDLYDRLYAMLRDYERVQEYYERVDRERAEEEEERAEVEAVAEYNRILAACDRIRLRIEGRAKLRYPRSKAWQSRYVRESLAADEEWQELCAAKEALPVQVGQWAWQRRNVKTA